jgi:pentatricopeptide repeat protein
MYLIYVLVSTRVLLKLFGKHGSEEDVAAIVELMKQHHICHNAVSFNALLSVYAKAGDIPNMESCVSDMEDEGISLNLHHYNTLTVGYGQAKQLDGILACFEAITAARAQQARSPDELIVYFSTLMNALGKAEQYDELETHYYKMTVEHRVRPAVGIFQAILHTLPPGELPNKFAFFLNELMKQTPESKRTAKYYHIVLHAMAAINRTDSMLVVAKEMESSPSNIRPTYNTKALLAKLYLAEGNMSQHKRYQTDQRNQDEAYVAIDLLTASVITALTN